MPFVITCRAWEALFKAKETKQKKKNAKLESKKERERKKK